MSEDIPASFQAACDSIFTIPSTEKRVFACRGYVSKRLGTTGTLTPACFLVAANRIEDAEKLALCVRDILDHIGIQETACTISRAHTHAILDILSLRVLLLTLQEGISVFFDMGIPVIAAEFNPINNLVVVPFNASVGFNAAKCEAFVKRVPYL